MAVSVTRGIVISTVYAWWRRRIERAYARGFGWRRSRNWQDECLRLRRAQVIGRVGSWHWDVAAGQMTMSDSLLELHGVTRDGVLGASRSLRKAVHPADWHRVVATFRELQMSDKPVTVRYRVVISDGVCRWFDARGVVERDPAASVRQLVGTVADVTELVQAELEAQAAHEELSQAHSFQQAVIAATPDAIHIYEVATGRLCRANRSGRPLSGFSEASARVLAGHDVGVLIPADDAAQLVQAFRDVTHLDGEVIRLRHRVFEPGAEIRWLSRRVTPFERDESGVVTQVLVISRDVTDVVAMEQRLKQAALHDELTGLPNRRLISDRLEQSLRRATRAGSTAVLLIDLDGFKTINDTRGHSTGDAVLVETAARLRSATRTGDTAGRLGGDEFVVLLHVEADHDPTALAEGVAQRLVENIREPILIDGNPCVVTASIGIAITATEHDTPESLLASADAAMYFTKAHGSNGHTLIHAMTNRNRPQPMR